METIPQLDNIQVEHGSTQPPHIGGSLAAEGREHGQGVDGAPSLRPSVNSLSGESPGSGLEPSGGGHGAEPATTQVPAVRADGVETLGRRSGATSHAVAAEISGGLIRGKRRRPCPSAEGGVNQRSVLELLTRQGFRCALTGRPLTPEIASLDHIVPVCRGGEHRIQNTQVLERNVNRAKGTLTNEEFITLCGEVWRHAGMQAAVLSIVSQDPQ